MSAPEYAASESDDSDAMLDDGLGLLLRDDEDDDASTDDDDDDDDDDDVDVDADEGDEDDDASVVAPEPSAEALREMRADNPFADEDLELLAEAKRQQGALDYTRPLLNKKRAKQYEYGVAAVRDAIDAPLYGPHDWIWVRGAASQVYDNDARAHQYILRATLPRSSDAVPRRGEQRIVTPPKSIDKVVFHRWMHKTTPRLQTTNVVATFHLGNSVPLPDLCRTLAGVFANPRCFAAVKLTCDTATHLIFPGGSVVTPGASPFEAAHTACLNCTEMLQRSRFMVEFSQFSVQNIASTASAGFEINLRALARAYPLNVQYEPTCFPGLRFRTHIGRIVVTVYKAGRCILVGATSRTEALVAWRWFHSYVLWQFEMHNGEAYTTEADYRRRTQVENSIVDSVCESLRDMTQAHVATLLARISPDGSHAPSAEQMRALYDRPEVADEFYRGVALATNSVGYGNRPKLTLDDFLAEMSGAT
jgi:TATA-box binding protein (TBP) (component of TFIID and TFIIIB)